jgi:hypothetical protein
VVEVAPREAVVAREVALRALQTQLGASLAVAHLAGARRLGVGPWTFLPLPLFHCYLETVYLCAEIRQRLGRRCIDGCDRSRSRSGSWSSRKLGVDVVGFRCRRDLTGRRGPGFEARDAMETHGVITDRAIQAELAASVAYVSAAYVTLSS